MHWKAVSGFYHVGFFKTVISLKTFMMTKQDWSYHAEMSLNGKDWLTELTALYILGKF